MLQESNRVELKEKLNEKLEREICAFLNNREGGVLYIGVADDGSVVGVSDADALQKKVAERIRDKRERYRALAERSLAAMREILGEEGIRENSSVPQE